jgi:subtilisin family serine protease
MVVTGMPMVHARSEGTSSVLAVQGITEIRRYIVELHDQPLASYDGRPLSVPSRHDKNRLAPTSIQHTGRRKLNVQAIESIEYLEFLKDRQESILLEAAIQLGRQINPKFSYRNAVNGMALDLSPTEAQALSELPMIKSVTADTRHQYLTYAGPKWLGAEAVWDGESGIPEKKGEGVVIGIIDGGINWDHPSFEDPGQDGYNHVNPYDDPVGLCDMEEVLCNNKLVGVYDFVEDDPSSEIIEGSTNGKDDDGHGSHVAATAAGNTLNVTINELPTTLSGVAPHANLITYRVCFAGDPQDPESGGCFGSAIIEAIDTAISDGVDVINYSLGGEAFNPWAPGNIPRAFLNARNAGIVVVAAAGNEGPEPGTIGSPANAPWVTAVGNATHNRLFGTTLGNLSGGDSDPPASITGASLVGSSATLPIVHAKDFGFALCASGPAELSGSCEGNQGISNPWDGDQPFTGMIVVCDRGTYGRIEKGKNVMLAGAEGYVLANTEEQGEQVVADNHCLPASHISDKDGDDLRMWLESGSGHGGRIFDFELAQNDQFADRIAGGSSRGPGKFPVRDVLKPNVIAPGTRILAASDTDDEFWTIDGTSMSSPHVAGAAALIKSVHPDWSVAQITSVLESTSTAALAHNETSIPATPFDFGSGRLQLGNAARAGLFLDISVADFNQAEPGSGGDPKDLNLSGLVDSSCVNTCGFSRTVTDQVGGASWSAAPVGFPAGVEVTITPKNFMLGDGDSRTLDIEVDVLGAGITNQWLYGTIVLSSGGLPDQALTVAVFSSLEAELPSVWVIEDDRNGGWVEFELSGMPPLTDATFKSGGLVQPRVTTKKLKQDPTSSTSYQDVNPQNEDPFDGGTGTYTVWHNVPAGSLWVYAETLASTAVDLDLFIGLDVNDNGQTEQSELLCESISPGDEERCDILNPDPGSYWIIVQNWEATAPAGDEATLLSAVVNGKDSSDFVVSGPGMVEAGALTVLRTSWNNNPGLPGEQLLAAVGIGTDRENPNNVGVIPVFFNRDGIAPPETISLFNEQDQQLALAGDGVHDRIYFDVPPDITQLVIQAHGASNSQSNNLEMDIYRQDFAEALDNPPFVQVPGNLQPIANRTGGGGTGPSYTLNSAETITPGRYYVKLTNIAGADAAVTLRASVTSNESSLTPHQTLWGFERRISQGISWDIAGNNEAGLWYTYDEDGQPTWFIFSSKIVAGNIWTTPLLRVTNDGELQQEKQAGQMSVTFISDTEAIFSYRLYGYSGHDPLYPNSNNTCPDISGVPTSYTGLWGRGIPGLGGATIVVYESSQAQVHYFFDAVGVPRWLIAADDDNQSATAEVIPMLQFNGFCAVCDEVDPEFVTVGTVDRTFTDDSNGSWTLDFELEPPLIQMINRTDTIKKVSDTVACQ